MPAAERRRADADVSGRLRLRVPLAAAGARLHRRLRRRLAAQDQRHQRLCRLDRLVELLLAPDPQPSGPRRLAGVQRRDRAAADGARHLQDARAHARALLDRRGRLGRRARRRSRHQQAARPEPAGHRVQARASLRHQPGRRRRDAGRDRRRRSSAFSGVLGPRCSRWRRSSRWRSPSSRAGDRLGDQGPLLSRPHAAAELERTGRRSAAAICEHQFEPEDMAHCPAYSGPICSLCCSLDARCHDCCKPQARALDPGRSAGSSADPAATGSSEPLNTDIGRYLGVLLLFGGVIGSVLSLVYFQVSLDVARAPKAILQVDAVDRLLHPHDHRRRRRLAVRAGAGEPPRRRGGDAAPDRPADARDRGAQAHRRQAAEGQGGGRSRQARPRAATSSAQPRAAHAAQCHPRLRAAPGARPGDSGAAGRRRSR